MVSAISVRPGAHKAVKPQNFAAPHVEAHVLNRSPQLRPRTSSATSPIRGGSDVARQVQAAPDHQVGDLVLVGLRRVERAAILPVPQHADAVGDLEDFLHPVRDVDDADAPDFRSA